MRKEGAVRTGERAAAKEDGADGANRLVIRNADVSTWRFFLDGHFGHDGKAHARADHAEKAAELAAFENDLRMETRAVAGGNGGNAETMAGAPEQDRLGAKICAGKRPARMELVILGECGDEPLGQ